MQDVAGHRRGGARARRPGAHRRRPGGRPPARRLRRVAGPTCSRSRRTSSAARSASARSSPSGDAPAGAAVPRRRPGAAGPQRHPRHPGDPRLRRRRRGSRSRELAEEACPADGSARRPHRGIAGPRPRHHDRRSLDARATSPTGCPATRTCSCPGCDGDSLLYLLDAAGVECSTGSACQAGVPQPSHVLLAMGVPEEQARGALRLTLGHTSTRRGRRRGPRRPAGRRRARPPRVQAGSVGGDEVLMRVVAAMSGGVDSAVAAARMLDAGHEVVGVHLALSQNAATLRESARGCCTIEDAGDARRVADVLGIPFYVWDMAARFTRRRRRGLPRGVRRRPHAQPVPPLQRADQVRRAARQGGRPRLRRRGHRPLRPGRRAAGRPARAAPRRRPGQGPVLRPRRPRRGPAGPLLLPARRHHQAADPRGGRGPRLLRREQAGQPRHLLHPRRRHPRLPQPDRLGEQPGDIVDTDGTVVGPHSGAYAFTVGQRTRPRAWTGRPRTASPATSSRSRRGPTRSSSAPADLLGVDAIIGDHARWCGPRARGRRCASVPRCGPTARSSPRPPGPTATGCEVRLASGASAGSRPASRSSSTTGTRVVGSATISAASVHRWPP